MEDDLISRADVRPVLVEFKSVGVSVITKLWSFCKDKLNRVYRTLTLNDIIFKESQISSYIIVYLYI